MHADYVLDSEEFFSNERKAMATPKKIAVPVPLKRTVSITPQIDIAFHW